MISLQVFRDFVFDVVSLIKQNRIEMCYVRGRNTSFQDGDQRFLFFQLVVRALREQLYVYIRFLQCTH